MEDINLNWEGESAKTSGNEPTMKDLQKIEMVSYLVREIQHEE